MSLYACSYLAGVLASGLLLVMGEVACVLLHVMDEGAEFNFLVNFFDMSLPRRCLRSSHETRRVSNQEPLQFNDLCRLQRQAAG